MAYTLYAPVSTFQASRAVYPYLLMVQRSHDHFLGGSTS